MKSIGSWVWLVALALLPTLSYASTKPLPPRRVVSLDGQWQIDQGSMATVPASFWHTVVVPGLIDMAAPAFADVGRPSKLREAFWYRRTFRVDGPIPDVALLKINKARYGTKVFLNGKLVGEHVCLLHARLFRRERAAQGRWAGKRVDRSRGGRPRGAAKDTPTGWDFEKYLYIPGYTIRSN